jgi:hypothetical protein
VGFRAVDAPAIPGHLYCLERVEIIGNLRTLAIVVEVLDWDSIAFILPQLTVLQDLILIPTRWVIDLPSNPPCLALSPEMPRAVADRNAFYATLRLLSRLQLLPALEQLQLSPFIHLASEDWEIELLVEVICAHIPPVVVKLSRICWATLVNRDFVEVMLDVCPLCGAWVDAGRERDGRLLMTCAHLRKPVPSGMSYFGTPQALNWYFSSIIHACRN